MDSVESPPEQRYILDLQVGYMLRLANQRHASIFSLNIGDELTPTQFAALMRLAQHGDCSQNELGRLAAMDIATIKGVVDRLRQKGLVESRPSREDRRRTLISLSEKGRGMIEALQDVGAEITRQTLEPLTLSERRTFLRLLQKLS